MVPPTILCRGKPRNVSLIVCVPWVIPHDSSIVCCQDRITVFCRTIFTSRAYMIGSSCIRRPTSGVLFVAVMASLGNLPKSIPVRLRIRISRLQLSKGLKSLKGSEKFERLFALLTLRTSRTFRTSRTSRFSQTRPKGATSRTFRTSRTSRTSRTFRTS